MQDKQGNTALHNPDAIGRFLPMSKEMKFEELQSLLCIKNKQGKLPLESPRIFELMLSIIKQWDAAQLELFSSSQIQAGNSTLLFRPHVDETKP